MKKKRLKYLLQSEEKLLFSVLKIWLRLELVQDVAVLIWLAAKILFAWIYTFVNDCIPFFPCKSSFARDVHHFHVKLCSFQTESDSF